MGWGGKGKKGGWGGAWGFGKGWGKGWGKGKGKGKPSMWEKKKIFGKLEKVDTSCKVFVGSLPKGLSWQDLEKHMAATASKPSITHIMSFGKAVCAFSTAEEATAAIASVNGSTLKDKTLVCEPWTTKQEVMKAKRGEA